MQESFDEMISNIFSELTSLRDVARNFDKRLTEIEEKTREITSHIYEYDGVFIG